MNNPLKRLSRFVLRWESIVVFSILVALGCSMVWKAQMLSAVGPTWRGITVGESSADDLTAILGAPSSVEQGIGETVYLYQEGRFPWAVHRVVIRQGVVEQISEDMAAYFPRKITLTQFTAQYGLPDRVMWSRQGPGLRTVIFLDEGVIVTVTALPLDEAEATNAIYYRPRSLARVLVDFKDEASLINPFPHSDVVGPRDPWFGTP